MLAKNEKYYTSHRILTRYIVLLIIVPYIVLNVLQTALYMRSMQNEIISANMELTEQINLNVEKQVDKIKSFVYMLSASNELKELLKASNEGSNNYYVMETYNSFSDIISNSVMSDINIKSVVVTNGDARIFTYGKSGYFDFEGVSASEWYNNAINAEGGFCWSAGQADDEENSEMYVLAVAKQLRNIKTLENMGVIYVEVYNPTVNLVSDSGREGNIMCVVDEHNEPLFFLSKEESDQNRDLLEMFGEALSEKDFAQGDLCRIGDNSYITVESGRNNHSWFIVNAIPVKHLMSNLIAAGTAGVVVLLSCMILFIVVFNIIQNRVSRPLQYLLGLVNEINADPDLDIDLGKYPCYEAIMLKTELVTLFEENKLKSNELEEVAAVKTKIEMDKLQAEINPHFIYNTLTAIKYMALESNRSDISNMITALVKILRSSVNRDGRMIPVSEELDNLHQYIYIQKILNKDRIEFNVVTDPGADECYMPNFILQPLVENAVIHGLNPKGCEGSISVNVRREGEMLVIEVIDDGVGIDAASANTINSGETEAVSSIALPGIRKKIKLLYGESGVFRIEAVPEGGTKATVIIPARFK